MKKNMLVASFILSLFGCSDPQSEVEKEFVKVCYYGSNTHMSKDVCGCIYKDLINSVYSETEIAKILRDDYPQDQIYATKNKLRDSTMKSYLKCK